MRKLGQNARAVAGSLVRAHTTAMGQIDETAKRQLDDAARGLALDVDDQSNAAAIVLVRVLVQRKSGLPCDRSISSVRSDV